MKELDYYLDATPSHSYLKMLYKYPQGEFPYGQLGEEITCSSMSISTVTTAAASARRTRPAGLAWSPS